MSGGLALEDRQAIEDLIHRFYWLVDEGRASEGATLFTADASITFGPGAPRPGTTSGADLGPMLVARQAMTHVLTRHVLSNLQMEPCADGSVIVRLLMTLYRTEDGTRAPTPNTIADVTEVVVRDGGAWRFARREIRPIFY